MSFHRSYLLTVLFIALLLAQAHQSAKAQNVFIVTSSSVTYDAATNKVNGVSQTSMDYKTNLYYRARAKGYLYTQNIGSPLAVSENLGSPGQAVVTAQSQANASPYTTYNLKTEHYLLPRYCEAGCSYYLDYYNYYYSSPYAYYGAASEFGPSQTIYGCNPYPYQTCYPDTVYGWIWMGNTNATTLTQPGLSITNSRISGNLKGTTQNVLLASPAGLQATVTPAGLGGNFVWSFTGPFTQDSASQDNSYRSIFWTQPGTYAATVTYSGGGFSVSGTVNIQVRVPTLTSFNGTASNTVVNRGSNCANIFTGQNLPLGTTVSMGCSVSQDGMVYSAGATIPNVIYLSDPAKAGIIFKQIVSAYRKQNSRGRFECRTARNPQSDPTTGWQIDSIAVSFIVRGPHLAIPLQSRTKSRTCRAPPFQAAKTSEENPLSMRPFSPTIGLKPMFTILRGEIQHFRPFRYLFTSPTRAVQQIDSIVAWICWLGDLAHRCAMILPSSTHNTV